MSQEPEFKLTLASRLIILTAVMASLLEIIDTSIVNVAIPTMMGNLGATLEDISWVVTGYVLANAIVLPLSAWLGSRIGRRKYYVTCILLFTLTSVLCGIAPNLLSLTIFRILQGLFGGALLPTSQALIQEQFPRSKAGIASAIYGMSVMIGPTIGPTLGGYLTDNYGWRSIFNINLPLGLFAAYLAYTFVKNYAEVPGSAPPQTAAILEASGNQKPSKPKAAPIDGIGLGLLTLGVGCLQFVLERGQSDDWFASNTIVICTLLSAFSIPTFIWWELKFEHPIVNLRLFKEPLVRIGTLLMLCLGLMLYGLVFIIPVFVGSVLRFNATQTGMLFIPGALLTAFCMPFIGRAMGSVGPKRLIFCGIMIIELCLYMMTEITAQTGEPQLFNILLVRGLGMAFLFVPINGMVLGHFSGVALGQVAGLMNLSRQLGGSIGIAMIATLLERRNHQNEIDLLSKVSLLEPATRNAMMQFQGGMASKFPNALGMVHSSQSALHTIAMKVQAQVFILSFEQLMWSLLILFGLALIPLSMVQGTEKVTGPVDVH
jgi:DHA2 family multidrug resistance protein